MKNKMLNELIPPYNLNYNYQGAEGDYYDKFSSNFRKFYLPQSIINSNNSEIQNGLKVPKILDLGCGFGNMAHSLAIAIQASQPLRSPELDLKEIYYLGIDIRSDAINWLNDAYAGYENFLFHHHQASDNADYIGEFSSERKAVSKTSGHSDGSECLYNIGFDFQADIQWSSSFFTHLTFNASLESLNFASKHLKSNGVTINTWLIADVDSCLAMFTGEADRICSIDFGHYLTYSQDNPLVCTVYKLEAITELYDKAGLKIINILRGSWRGSHTQNSFNHYQDIVIAVKKK